MLLRAAISILAFCAGFLGMSISADEPGDPINGQKLFGACVACHSMERGRHMTGPSLASIWGRQAGTIEGFARYSDPLKQSEIVWDDVALDAWIANPNKFIPGNRMTFRGLPDERQRRDLIAYLRLASDQGQPSNGQQSQGIPQGEIGGMMERTQLLDLNALQTDNQVASISFCGDTYTVTTKTGEIHQIWEFNLRFKTDGSDMGPPAGSPVVIPASMMGDRAFVIFAKPTEISAFIIDGCPQ